MQPRKNSASGSWVDASAEAALCGKVCVAASRSRVGLGCAHTHRDTQNTQTNTHNKHTHNKHTQNTHTHKTYTERSCPENSKSVRFAWFSKIKIRDHQQKSTQNLENCVKKKKLRKGKKREFLESNHDPSSHPSPLPPFGSHLSGLHPWGPTVRPLTLRPPTFEAPTLTASTLRGSHL